MIWRYPERLAGDDAAAVVKCDSPLRCNHRCRPTGPLLTPAPCAPVRDTLDIRAAGPHGPAVAPDVCRFNIFSYWAFAASSAR